MSFPLSSILGDPRPEIAPLREQELMLGSNERPQPGWKAPEGVCEADIAELWRILERELEFVKKHSRPLPVLMSTSSTLMVSSLLTFA